MTKRKTTSQEIPQGVCHRCGVTANVLTCLKKYGQSPNQLSVVAGTSWRGRCRICGREDSVGSERDYYHPDFSLIEKVVSFLKKND